MTVVNGRKTTSTSFKESEQFTEMTDTYKMT